MSKSWINKLKILLLINNAASRRDLMHIPLTHVADFVHFVRANHLINYTKLDN